MAAKKEPASKAKKAKSIGSTKKTAKSKKARPKKAAARRSGTTGLDKSVEHFRESLEENIHVSRDRLQEAVDDAVKRGRMTRNDAEKLFKDVVKRGRKETDNLLKELERLVGQVRKEVGGRATPVRKQATQAARRARKKLG